MLVEALHLAVAGLGIVAAMMFVLWLVHLLIRNAAIVDVGWAAGLATLAIFYGIEGPGYPARKWAIAAMAGFWGLRWQYTCFFRVCLASRRKGATSSCGGNGRRISHCASCFSLSFRRC